MVTQPRALNSKDRRVVLAFDRALGRETNNLARWPQLLWQQCYNDIRWQESGAGEELVPLSVRHATAAADRPWARRMTPARRAAALSSVLEVGHYEISCVVGPLADSIMAGNNAGTLQIWDPRTGEKTLELEVGQEDPPTDTPSGVRLCGMTSLGDLVTVDDYGCSLNVRDAATGRPQRVLKPETGHVLACAEAGIILTEEVEAPGGWILFESMGGVIRFSHEVYMDHEQPGWHTLDELNELQACAVSPDGRNVVVVGDGKVVLWGVQWERVSTGMGEPLTTRTSITRLKEWRGQRGGLQPDTVVACAASYGGEWIALAQDDGTISIWDGVTGDEHAAVHVPEVVTCCAVSPDGAFVLAGTRTGALLVGEGRGGQPRLIPEAHPGGVDSCAMSQDGAFFVSTGADGLVTIWDRELGSRRVAMTSRTGRALACAVSANGENVLAATDYGCIEVWWALSGEFARAGARRTAWGPYEFDAYGFDPGAGLVVAASRDGAVTLWDVHAADRRMVLHTGRKITSCAVSPSGDFVVTGDQGGVLSTWDSRNGTLIGQHQAHDGAVTVCRLGPGGDFVVSAATGSVRAWDLPNWKQRFELESGGSEVLGCAVSPDGQFVAFGGKFWTEGGAPSLKIVDALTGEERAVLEGHGGTQIDDCVVSPDGDFVVSAGNDRILHVWDARTAGNETRQETAGGGLCTFSPDGDFVVTGFGKPLVVDARTGEERFRLQAHERSHSETGNGDGEQWVMACAVSPDADFIVTGEKDETVMLWDASSGRQRRTLTPRVGVTPSWTHENTSASLAVSPDGNLVVSSEFGGSVRVWDIGTDREWVLEGVRGYMCCLTADGTGVVSGDGIWDTHTGAQVLTIEDANMLAMSPDGDFVVSGDPPGRSERDRGIIRMWDAHTGELRGALKAYSGEVGACAVSPDGRYLISAGDDVDVRGVIKVWALGETSPEIIVPILSSVESLDVHPWFPVVACGDFTGNLNLLELARIEYGPIVVSARDDGSGPTARCPACRQEISVRDDGLGDGVACPGCGIGLKINPFVIERRREPLPSPESATLAESEAALTPTSTPEEQPRDALSRLSAWSGVPEETPRRGWFKRRRRK